jgi:hypothetical protein
MAIVSTASLVGRNGKLKERKREERNALLLLCICPQVDQELLILLRIAAELSVERPLSEEVGLERGVAFFEGGDDGGELGVERGEGGAILREAKDKREYGSLREMSACERVAGVRGEREREREREGKGRTSFNPSKFCSITCKIWL